MALQRSSSGKENPPAKVFRFGRVTVFMLNQIAPELFSPLRAVLSSFAKADELYSSV